MKKTAYILILVLWAVLPQSCILIDDDLSVCGRDYVLNYEMRLVTNMNMEINEVLCALEDTTIKRALRDRLTPIFTDRAHDVDLSFYNMNSGERTYYISEVIDDNRTSFTFYLPKESYRHLSVANIEDAENVSLTDTVTSETARLLTIDSDTLSSMSTGLFSARLDMEVQDTVDQEFEVNLYMVNSAVALVVDTTDALIDDIQVFVTGMASGFSVNDSTFLFDRSPVHKTDLLKTSAQAVSQWRMPAAATADEQKQICFTSINFPSPDTPDASGTYWGMNVYVTLPDNTVTETKLTVASPLEAGSLKVLKTKIGSKGAITPIATTEVGATVTLDWKPAGEHDQTW